MDDFEQRKAELKRRARILQDAMARPLPAGPELSLQEQADLEADIEYQRLKIQAGRQSEPPERQFPANVIDLTKHRRCRMNANFIGLNSDDGEEN